MLRYWDSIFARPSTSSHVHSLPGDDDLSVIFASSSDSDSDLILQSFDLLAITDTNVIGAFSQALTQSDLLRNAPILVAICSSLSRTQADLLEFLGKLDYGSSANDHYKRYSAVASSDRLYAAMLAAAARCSARLVLAARGQGYAAFAFDVFDMNRVRSCVDIPEEVQVFAVVSLGEPISQKRAGITNTSLSVFSETWGRPLVEPEPAVLKYRNSLVSYFDILGFRKIVNDLPPVEIDEALRELLSLSANDATLRRVSRRGLSAFSDHIVRTVDIEGLDDVQRLDAIEMELIELQHIQANLVSKGILLRGAMVCGPIYIDEEVVFGPALIKAYELERDFAKYPRVLFDGDTLLASVGNDPRIKRRLDLLYANLLFQSKDTRWSINYLQVGDDLDEQMSLLLQHADLIRNALSQKLAPDVAEKYEWLRDFHNAGVMRIADIGVGLKDLVRDDLLIR